MKTVAIVKAFEDLREHKLSLRAAAAAYGVPHRTLHDYTTGKSKLGCTSGPDTLTQCLPKRRNRSWLSGH